MMDWALRGLGAALMLTLGGLLTEMACGCAAAWTDKDTRAVTASARLELALETLCAADDAGYCTPPTVRALERAAFCADDSTLFRHGAAIDSGIICAP